MKNKLTSKVKSKKKKEKKIQSRHLICAYACTCIIWSSRITIKFILDRLRSRILFVLLDHVYYFPFSTFIHFVSVRGLFSWYLKSIAFEMCSTNPTENAPQGLINHNNCKKEKRTIFAPTKTRLSADTSKSYAIFICLLMKNNYHKSIELNTNIYLIHMYRLTANWCNRNKKHEQQTTRTKSKIL